MDAPRHTADQPIWPAWWETDREHAPALLALRFLRAENFIRPDAEPVIDFEGLWNDGPNSGGERVLIALAWGLYNLSWAAEWAEANPDRMSPLRAAHPSRAAEILGDNFQRVYLTMVRIGFCNSDAEVAELLATPEGDA